MRRLASMILASSCLTTLGLSPAVVAEDDIFKTLFEEGKVDLNLRYRFAFIDEDTFDLDARASTLRTFLGFRTGTIGGFEAYAQVRNVVSIGGDTFNDTVNGRIDRPVEADPESTAVHQAYLSYKAPRKTVLSAGRKGFRWGNQRFVSDVAWRQNYQSMDGLFLDSEPTEWLTARYAYVWNVNRVLTDDNPAGNFSGDIHLGNLEATLGGVGKLTGYYYGLDFSRSFEPPLDARALATRTVGANLTGKQDISGGFGVGYMLEAAQQSDIGQNPFDIDLAYFRIEPKLISSFADIRVGYEYLEGNGTRGFAAPLGLVHAYNGTADRFLTTPADGLEDRYAEIVFKPAVEGFFSKVRASLAYHEFNSTEGNISYGTEWDGQISAKVNDRFNVLLKFAAYDAQNFSRDVTKIWFQVAIGF